MRWRQWGRKKWVAVLGVPVLAVAGTGAWVVLRPEQSAATTTTITAAVTRGDLRQTVSTSGTLAPARRADLTFEVSGTVTTVPVAVGDKVAEGAVLATIDDDELSADVDAAQASVNAAQDQVDSADDGTQAEQASAAAQLNAAKSTLARAKTSLAQATLSAPFAGTVAAVDVAVGDLTGGSGSNGSGAATGNSTAATSTAAVTVISTNAWVVDASVGASDLASVKKGLQVEVTPDGSSEKVYGTVKSVGVMASTSTSGSATFPVTIAVTGAPTGLYAGGTVTAAIVVKQIADVLTVPSAAVSTQDGSTYVTVTANGKQTKTRIVIGTVLGNSTEVKSGLTEGQQIVVREIQLPAGAGNGGTRQGQNGTRGGEFPGGGQFPGGQIPGGGQFPGGQVPNGGQVPVPGAGQ